jgi:hypothetical protein
MGQLMGILRAIVAEIVGLFVDDGSLALALVLWCAATGLATLVLPGLPGAWLAAALTAGCVAILLANVVIPARRRRVG